jgi:hypothetical protein
MQDNKAEAPEVKLLRDIIAEEVKDEGDEKLKGLIQRKAEILYSLLSVTKGQDLSDDELRERIKSVIEEG